MRRLIASAALLGLLSAPALAQVSMGSQAAPSKGDDPAEKQMKEQVDRDYKATLKRTAPSTANAAPVDPWGTIRESNPGKTKR